MCKKDYRLLEAYKATGLTPEQIRSMNGRAKWKPITACRMRCTSCGYGVSVRGYTFCPHCGAIMTGADDESTPAV